MKHKYNCILTFNVVKVFLISVLFFLPNSISAQVGTQSPSIRNNVTFQWSDTQDDDGNGTIDATEDNDSATIESITINGTIYNTFVVPSAYELTRLGPGGNNLNRIRRNNTDVVSNSSSSNGDANSLWNSSALNAFQDKNLNHYYTSNGNGRNICLDFNAANGMNGVPETDAQLQTLSYNPAIPSNQGGILAVTERGGNNCFYVRLTGFEFGSNTETILGDTFVRTQSDLRGSNVIPPTSNSDYWQSGRKIDNGQAIAIALFDLSSVAPTGSRITKIEFLSATRDDGDGKFFILQRYAQPQLGVGCIDGIINGQIDNSTSVPTGSTYELIGSPSPNPAGSNLVFNSDGSYTYTPALGFLGDVTFQYRVRLPAPNENITDENTVTLTYSSPPDHPEILVSCNADGTYNIEITSPVGNQFEYNINGGTYQSSPIFSNLSDGNYNFGVFDRSTSCINEPSDTNITLTALDAVIDSTSDVECFGAATGSIDISVTGGFPPYTFNWTSDDSGFSATTEDLTNIPAGSYNVEISDTSGCSFTFPDPIIIEEPSSDISTAASIINDIACFGNSDGSIDLVVSGGTPNYTYAWSNGETTQDISGLSAGDYTVTITDANDCTLVQTFTIVQPDAELSQSATITDVNCFGAFTGAINLEVSGGTPNYTYLWSNGETTQDISGLSAGIYTITITDDNNCSLVETFTIEQPDADLSQCDVLDETIECNGNANETLADAWNATNIQILLDCATDNCGGNFTVTSDYDYTNLVNTCGATGTIDVIYTLTDTSNNSSTYSATFTIEDNTAPVFDTLPAESTITCPATPDFAQATATDNCGNSFELTFEDITTNGNCTNDYSITRTWTATDDCGNISMATQTINVIDNEAPIFDPLPAETTIDCSETPVFEDATATDTCGAVTLSFTDETTQGDCEANFTVTRTWTATDDCGNSSTAVQIINVADTTAPSVTMPADITLECSDDTSIANTGEATATDNCSTDVEISSNDIITAGNCDGEYTITRTWTATDQCGNTSSEVQTITVIDTTAPEISEPEGSLDVTIECSDVNALNDALNLEPTATDNCSTNTTITLISDSTVEDADCPNASVRTRTWAFDDGCGNISEPFVQAITIQDTTAPVLITTNFEDTITTDCDNIPEIPELQFEDNCSTDVIVTFTEDINFLSGTDDYEIIRTWTVDDGCGNIAIFDQFISVITPIIIPQDGDRCIDDGVINLFDFLQPGVNTNGTWSIVVGDNISLMDNLFNPEDGGQVGETYTFNYSLGASCNAEAEVNISINDDCIVLPCGLDDVNISNTITINGDGINEFFQISGVESCNYVYDVEIYNRWGAVVYKNSNYQNDWRGQTINSSVGNADTVPTGTYYYIVRLRNSDLEPFAGPIYIMTEN